VTAEHWKRIKRVFTKAAQIEDPSKRDAYLRNTCQGEDTLCAEVDSLLRQHREAKHEHFLSAYSSMDGKTILHYRVLAKIGEGGMGIAYKALDTRLNRLVVLKLLPPLLMADPESRSRFVQEAKTASALNHPNVVTIHDIAQVNGVDVIVMEYVPGKTLDGVIPSTGLTVSLTLHYALQIVEGLAAAHKAHNLHGDLKPLNIMVTDDGRVKLLDFGLAKMLSSTHRDLGEARHLVQFGTQAYMAPEQLRDRNLEPGPRLEIFSFGLILHQMLSGSHPFGSGTGDELSEAIRYKDPRALPPKVSASLAIIVERCLQKKPEKRFRSMLDLMIALRKCHGVKNPNALPIGFPPPLSPTEDARHRREEMEAASKAAAVGFISSVEMEQIRAIAGRIGYGNIAKSREALAELASLMDGNASQAIRDAVTSTLRDMILTVDDFGGNVVPFPVRELRKSVLELIRKLSQGNLSRCFKGHDLESLDLARAAFARHQPPPRGFDAATERRHHAKPRDDYAPHAGPLQCQRRREALPANSSIANEFGIADILCSLPAQPRPLPAKQHRCMLGFAVALPLGNTNCVENLSSLRSFRGISRRRRR